MSEMAETLFHTTVLKVIRLLRMEYGDFTSIHPSQQTDKDFVLTIFLQIQSQSQLISKKELRKIRVAMLTARTTGIVSRHYNDAP